MLRLIFLSLTFLILPQYSKAIDVPVIESGSYVELRVKSGRANNYKINFFDNNKCVYSYWDLWTTTGEDCTWVQNGPEVVINIGKGGMRARFSHSGSGYMDAWAGTLHWTGSLSNYRYVWKDWKSPEERRRIAEQERLRKERELEKKKLAEIERNKNLYSTNSSNQSGGREYAKQVFNEKTDSFVLVFVLAGIGGAIGSVIGGPVGGFVGAFIGLVIAKLI